jgi:hypothetical protein
MLLTVLAALASTAQSAQWIGVNVGQCESSTVQFSILKQVGVCLKTPASIAYFRSYQLNSCSITNSMLSTSITVYTGSGCSGLSFNQAIDPLPTGCTNGTSLICEQNPVALSEHWPAVGVYVEDTTCSLPTVVVAAKSDCTSFEYGPYSYSSSLSCDSSSMTVNIYNTSLTCEGNSQVSETVVLDSCTGMTDFLSYLPENLPSRLDELVALIDITGASYYADCGGATNLPGVEGGDPEPSDDQSQDGTKGSSGNSQDKFGGLGNVGLSVMLIGIVIAGVVGAVVVKRLAAPKKPDDTQNILL